MKMADGGYRPGYNIQFATTMAGDGIVGVAVTNVCDDHAEFVPMVDQIQRRTGACPHALVVDAGIATKAGITTLASRGITTYAPVRARKRHDRDPTQRCPDDSDAVAAWRQRMATDDAKAIYRQRGSVAERINADARTHRTLGHIAVRGLAKVHTWVLWVALAHNLVRTMEIIPHLMT